jgi:DNA sulfur modification protein DndD
MIVLKNAKFTNFKAFRNVTLKFSTDQEKKLTVVRAANGTGKTTLMTALTWGLFGDEALQGGKKNRNKDRLSPTDWDYRKDGKDISICVEIEVEVIDEETKKPTSYQIIRRQSELFADSMNFVTQESELTVLKKTPQGDVVQPQPEFFLERTFLPFPLKDIFFFDGDSALKFTDTTDSNGRRQRVESAIKKLLGLEILEQAESHLENAKAEILRRIKTENPGTPIDELVTKEIQLKEEINKLKSAVRDLRENYASLLDQKLKQESLKDEILSKGGGKQDELRRDLEAATKQLKAVEDELERNVRSLREKLNTPELLFQISNNFLEKADEIFTDLQQKKIIPNTLPEILENVLKQGRCICGDDISDGTTGHKHISLELSNLKQQTSAHGLLLSLSQSLNSAFARSKPGAMNWVTNVSETQRTIVQLRQQESDLRLKKESLQVQIAEIPEANLQIVLNHINDLQASINEISVTQRVTETKIDAREAQLMEIIVEKGKVESKNKKLLKSISQQHSADDLMRVVKKTIDHLNGETIDEVSEKMNAIFMQMIGSDSNNDGKEASIVGVKLSREFDISVIGPEGATFSPQAMLSGAQNRALTVSFILALTHVSGESAMTVIDTPLGVTDTYIRRSMLKTLILESRQPILFLTYSEIMGVEDILDSSTGSFATMTNAYHYGLGLLSNKPKTNFNEVIVCECSHRQSCAICKRKEDQK